MTLIVLAAMAAGLVTSKILLEAGLTSTLARYPISVIGAYLTFLALVRFWSGLVLWKESFASRRRGLSRWLDFIDGPSSTGQSEPVTFAGGSSGGGGASGAWGTSDAAPSADSVFDSYAPGFDFDLGEAAGVIVVMAAFLLAVFGIGAYLVYSAPDILTEAALSVLSASNPPVHATGPERGWVHIVFRSTWLALALALLTSAGLARAVQHGCHGEKVASCFQILAPKPTNTFEHSAKITERSRTARASARP